jgi:16S rRNA A1518/A1519 N6-dimethyltransferase RsmA/KsgA/DIM1 with predicted DNA glycosylase/AP lyase activity
LQNYMLNTRVNEELVAAAGVEEGDVVLEIGPGTGSLTAALLAAGATVVAVEKVSSFQFANLALLLDQFAVMLMYP